jgi:hypothetical protein
MFGNVQEDAPNIKGWRPMVTGCTMDMSDSSQHLPFQHDGITSPTECRANPCGGHGYLRPVFARGDEK